MNNEDLIKMIGERVKRQREKLDLSQRELGQLAGEKTGKKITQTHLGKIEKGVQYPSLKMLKRIADTIPIEIEYFFTNDKKAEEIERIKRGLAILEKFERLSAEDQKIVEHLIEGLAFLGGLRKLSTQDEKIVEYLINRFENEK